MRPSPSEATERAYTQRFTVRFQLCRDVTLRFTPLTTTRQDDGKTVTSIVRLVMDDTNQTLAGTVTEDGVRKGIIYTRKK